MNIFAASLPLLLLVCAVPSAHAQPQRLNRCTDAGGQSVYTDRPCEAVGARARLPEATAPAAGNTQERNTLGASCPRRLSELVGALRGAVAANDVNRLSTLYLWSAVSDVGAQRILGQLESIARRPLVDIVPVYPTDEPDPGTPLAESTGDVALPRANPIGLRLHQVLPGTATPSSTVLGLRRQYGCFWITL
ncbi:DUF4124 domain-containing protein [Stenotrophomonas sp. CFBP 13725]|uniref:DUF4124 domain-containing protein n=1 Tax=Stenotrophomonas sp. CFBP 13725 TaxID=2775297 RepID=UPI001786D052|nr:DUF4124 domain-containing protein [Stenotrophomonas sp. CFBP 13725]MBD8636018.1 DUF4124 domain-containing protein [Stenotrophomonas sp. CFBP 13725]